MVDFSFCKFSFLEQKNKVIWEITNQCNYSCEYCIFSSTGKKPRGELPFQEVIKTLHQLKSFNFNYIKFTGGEPFLREDFIDILFEAKKTGFNFDISTNASLITEKISKKLSLLNMKFIHVSIDGYDKESHEFVRGRTTFNKTIKGFNKTIKGLNNLLKYNKNIRIGCVIHAKNDSKLSEMVFLANKFKVKELIFSLMSPIGRMDKKSLSLSKKTPEELIKIISTINSEYTKISHNLKSDIKPISFDMQKSSSVCPGGDKFLFIDSIGIVSPCTWVTEYFPEFHLESLHKNSLEEILKGNLFNSFNEEKKLYKSQCFASSDRKNKQFDNIYSFATENIQFIDLLPITNKNNALVITGSGDQAISLIEKGFKNITCLDLNYLSNFFTELKIIAIKNLTHKDFIRFISNNEQTLNYHVYKKISQDLSPECEKFWNQQYLIHKYNGLLIRNSSLFNLKYDDLENKFLNVPYLRSEDLFNKIKDEISLTKFRFITDNFINFKTNQKYDLILLSNIADYSHKMFNGDYLEEFKNTYLQNGLDLLSLDGLIMFAYIYDFENIGESYKRNKINLPEIRKQYFGEFNYEEIIVQSAISYLKNDVTCIIKNGK